MDRKTLLLASEKAAAFFEDQLDDLGQLKAQGVCGDLAAQYKLPTLLLLTGRAHLAHRVCCLPVCIPVDLSCRSAEGRQVFVFLNLAAHYSFYKLPALLLLLGMAYQAHRV